MFLRYLLIGPLNMVFLTLSQMSTLRTPCNMFLST
jgi:hypothetical protein